VTLRPVLLRRIVSNLGKGCDFSWPFSTSGDPLPVQHPDQSLLWSLEYAAEGCVYDAWGRERIVAPAWLKKLTISKQSLPSVELDPPDVRIRLLHREAMQILRSRLEVVVSYLTGEPLPASLQTAWDEDGTSVPEVTALDAARRQIDPFLTPSDSPRFLRWYAQERARLSNAARQAQRERARDRAVFLKTAGLNSKSTITDVVPALTDDAVHYLIESNKLNPLRVNEVGVLVTSGTLHQRNH
jgi:hypothetical protein